MSQPIWSPSASRIADSELSRFAAANADASGGVQAPDYQGLWRWSVQRPEQFWPAVIRHCDLRISSAEQVLVPGAHMQQSRWFVGSRLNFAENLLAPLGDEATALVARDESGQRRAWTGAELRCAVAQLADGLREDGVQAGDRVAGFLPNGAEAVIGMLATASLGAVWTSCSPDFGLAGVVDRFGQVGPKVLLACPGYRYAGKPIDTRARVAEIVKALPGLRRLVMVPGLSAPSDTGSAAMPSAIDFGDYGQRGAALVFHACAFNDPLYVMYSSGTTGKPKCIVHGVGGTLLQHAKELVLQSDIKPGDRLFFFTTCGWMMWNWLASGLLAGATLVLYDGSPFHPGPQALWELAEAESLSQLGISPKYLSALQGSAYLPSERVDLSSLRTLLSTGSPLSPEAYDQVYGSIKQDLQLASISGGTDIISCFALGNPWQPVHRGELQGPGLGMAVAIYDANGEEMNEGAGELVCTRPFPSMPVGFWNDAQGERYRQAYFQRFEGVWHHGDYAQRTASGGFLILGRSDATLNPGGVRIGTAEIYRVVESLPAVSEAVAVGYRHAGDEHVILFVCMAPGQVYDQALGQEIRAAIRAQLSPRHVPARVIPCPAVPRTISGKVTEIAVRELIHGRTVANADALGNPESLAFFESLAASPLL